MKICYVVISMCLSIACVSKTNSINAEQQEEESSSSMIQSDTLRQDTSNCSPILDTFLNRQVYSYVQEMPEFPGGQSEFYEFIYDHLDHKMPQDSFQGSVTVAFIIETDGSIQDAYAPKPCFKNGLSYLEKDLIKLVKEMPKWTPAKCNGKPVPIKFTLPIHF